MLNVKCALFQVMVAKYFSSCIPVIRETGGGEEGGRRVLRGFGLHGFTTDSNKLGAYECGGVLRVPPVRSERDTSSSSSSAHDVTVQRRGMPGRDSTAALQM